MYLKLAWRNIWRNKVRSIITMLLIFLFTLQVIFFQSLKKGTMLAVIDGLAGGYLGYVHVHEKGYWDQPFLDNAMEEDDDLIQTIESVDGVFGVSERMFSGALLTGNGKSFFGFMVGTDFDNEVTDLHSNVESEKLEMNEVIVASGLAENNKIIVGDTLTFTSQGMYGAFAADILIVKEIVKVNTLEMNGSLLMVNNNYFKEAFSAIGFTSELVVAIDDVELVDQTVNKIESKVDTTKYEVMSWKELRPEYNQLNELNDAGNIIMAGILYLLVFFGFLGTTLMMISERKREFGVLIAIGMSKFKIIITTFLESVLMATTACLAAFFIAFPLIYYFEHNPFELGGDIAESARAYGMEAILKTTVDPFLFMMNALIVFGLAIIVNVFGAIKIKRLTPVEAMKR